MVDSGPGQLPEQVLSGVKAEQASFLYVLPHNAHPVLSLPTPRGT